jgi:Ring hydroxylating alpha subunit (catalytic domain)
VPPLIFWPTSLTTTRLELITMAPDWGDGEAPDLWTVPDEASPNGRAMAKLIQEDTQFGEAIQRSMESRGFQSVPLSYQESRIYWFHQHCDWMIGTGNVPKALRVEQVIGEEWVSPNDPRLGMLRAHNQEHNQEAAE